MEVFQVSRLGPTEGAAEEALTDGGELTDRTKLIDSMTMEDSSVPFLRNAEAAVESAARKKQIKPLSLLPLIALIFYDVSGGPFGTEVTQHTGPGSCKRYIQSMQQTLIIIYIAGCCKRRRAPTCYPWLFAAANRMECTRSVDHSRASYHIP